MNRRFHRAAREAKLAAMHLYAFGIRVQQFSQMDMRLWTRGDVSPNHCGMAPPTYCT